MPAKSVLGYVDRPGLLHRVSGLSKLMLAVASVVGALVGFDARYLAAMLALNVVLWVLSRVKLRDLAVVLVIIAGLMLLNNVFIFLFAPGYGTELYGTRTVLVNGPWHWDDLEGTSGTRPRDLVESGHRDPRPQHRGRHHPASARRVRPHRGSRERYGAARFWARQAAHVVRQEAAHVARLAHHGPLLRRARGADRARDRQWRKVLEPLRLENDVKKACCGVTVALLLSYGDVTANRRSY